MNRAIQLFYKAQSLGYQILLDVTHGGYIQHLHIIGANGKLKDLHIQIVKDAWDFLYNMLK